MMMTQTKTNILDGNSLDIYPACPRTDYLYWVNTQSNYGIYEWKITGGSFKYMGQTVKEIRSFNASSVTVVWDNVKSINGKAPEGKITLKIYGKHGHDQIVANGNRSQIIKSLNDIIPSNLISNAPLTTVIPRGKQDVKVYLEKPLNYPGIKLPNGMPYVVNKYEWRIPVGWRPKTGEAPSSNNTYFTISPVIDLLTNEDTGGDVTVRGVNDCTGSEDFSVYSYPITFTRSGLVLGDFPTNIPLGEVETNVFTVIAPNPGTFEWRAPEKWKINNRENIHIAGNVVYITNGACYTDEKVKVGLYQDGEVSSLTEFPTSFKLPNILKPSGEIKQYQLATFSLGINDTLIESVEWLVNDNLIGKVANASSLTFAISLSGKVMISALLILENCSTVSILIPKIEVEVTEAPIPTIIGPYNICGRSTTFTLNNLPSNIPFSWSASPDIRIISEHGNSINVERNPNLITMNPTAYILADIGDPINRIIEHDRVIAWKAGINETTNLINIISFNEYNLEDYYTAQLKEDLLYTGATNFRWSVSMGLEITFNDGTMIQFKGNIKDSEAYIAVEFLNPCGEQTQIIHRFGTHSQ